MTQHKKEQLIGIIGDGQLALMLAESLLKMGLDFRCLSTSAASPMMRLFRKQTTLDSAIFRESCSVFTLENEFLSTAELENLLQTKIAQVFPDLPSYQHFGNKLAQRSLYAKLQLPSPHWMALTQPEQIPLVRQRFPFPLVLKASQGGYDGKGVRIIHSEEQWQQGLKDFGLDQGKALLIEEKINIKQEVAQGFLRRADGTATLLPLVHTIQQEGICNFVYYPAPVSSAVAQQIQQMLGQLMQHPLNGIFNFEFFIDQQDNVYINEGAPRPHNSQHLTIDAGSFSQFDLLAMYLADRPAIPHEISMHHGAMINLLGQSSGPDYQLIMPAAAAGVAIYPKLYGKELSAKGRKMGHVNIVDQSGQHDLAAIARKIFTEYKL